MSGFFDDMLDDNVRTGKTWNSYRKPAFPGSAADLFNKWRRGAGRVNKPQADYVFPVFRKDGHTVVLDTGWHSQYATSEHAHLLAREIAKGATFEANCVVRVYLK